MSQSKFMTIVFALTGLKIQPIFNLFSLFSLNQQFSSSRLAAEGLEMLIWNKTPLWYFETQFANLHMWTAPHDTTFPYATSAACPLKEGLPECYTSKILQSYWWLREPSILFYSSSYMTHITVAREVFSKALSNMTHKPPLFVILSSAHGEKHALECFLVNYYMCTPHIALHLG